MCFYISWKHAFKWRALLKFVSKMRIYVLLEMVSDWYRSIIHILMFVIICLNGANSLPHFFVLPRSVVYIIDEAVPFNDFIESYSC